MKRTAFSVVLMGMMLGMPAFAQMAHDHGRHAPDRTAVPQAAGHDAFGAIAEIVKMLSDDPETDWSRVDIGALRQHLLDMDALVTEARVTREPVPDGLRMRISRRGRGGEAAGRMVPMHGVVLSEETGWSSTVDLGDDEIVWSVTTSSEADAVKIRALGFFGLMATGAHHQRHHLAIARGEAMH
jgi:hypothetical protein